MSKSNFKKGLFGKTYITRPEITYTDEQLKIIETDFEVIKNFIKTTSYKFKKDTMFNQFDITNIFNIELNYGHYAGLQINIVSKFYNIDELDEDTCKRLHIKKPNNINDIILEITKTLFEEYEYNDPFKHITYIADLALDSYSTLKEYYKLLSENLEDFAKEYNLVELTNDRKNQTYKI